MTGKKVCACGKEFTPRHGLQIHCTRDCVNERNHNSPVWNSKQRDYKYKSNYGISIEDYNAMFEDQEGRCAICKKHQMEFKKKLHVDHKHETGQVRGLLCHNCNLAIGRLMEDPVIIKSALEYVS
jgi:hypothetical protein